MKKKKLIITIVIISLLLSGIITTFIVFYNINRYRYYWYEELEDQEGFNDKVITVDIGGSGDFTNLQAAIRGSSPGDIISIEAGVYTGIFSVHHRIKIEAADGDVILSGAETGTILTLEEGADGCLIDGIIVNDQGGSYPSTGLSIRSDGNIIRNCEISAKNTGIGISYSEYNIIRDCIIFNSFDPNGSRVWNFGLKLISTDHTLIQGNEISRIDMDEVDHTVIIDNQINGYQAIWIGEDSENTLIKDNIYDPGVVEIVDKGKRTKVLDEGVMVSHPDDDDPSYGFTFTMFFIIVGLPIVSACVVLDIIFFKLARSYNRSPTRHKNVSLGKNLTGIISIQLGSLIFYTAGMILLGFMVIVDIEAEKYILCLFPLIPASLIISLGILVVSQIPLILLVRRRRNVERVYRM